MPGTAIAGVPGCCCFLSSMVHQLPAAAWQSSHRQLQPPNVEDSCLSTAHGEQGSWGWKSALELHRESLIALWTIPTWNKCAHGKIGSQCQYGQNSYPFACWGQMYSIWVLVFVMDGNLVFQPPSIYESGAELPKKRLGTLGIRFMMCVFVCNELQTTSIELKGVLLSLPTHGLWKLTHPVVCLDGRPPGAAVEQQLDGSWILQQGEY